MLKVFCVATLACIVGCATTPAVKVSVTPGTGVEASFCIPADSVFYKKVIDGFDKAKMGGFVDGVLSAIHCPE